LTKRAKLAGLVVGAALSVWLFTVLFPGDDALIRRQLAGLARTLSVQPRESPLARLAAGQKFGGFFSPDVIVRLKGAGSELGDLQGRAQLTQAVMAAQARIQQAQIQFLDTELEVGADRQSATAHLTALAHVNGDPNPAVQELKFSFRKTDGRWRIAQVETVEASRR
jgi:hypothetical protein